MDPVEINAGAWYLLPLRPDDWAADTAWAWSVCDPTTAAPIAEVVLDPRSGILTSSARPGHDSAAAAAAAAVRRFAEATGTGGTGITEATGTGGTGTS